MILKKGFFYILTSLSIVSSGQTYSVVGTHQTKAFNNSVEIPLPSQGSQFYGQNANYPGLTPSYTENGDGTITDNITGLMWQKSPDFNNDGLINVNDKKTYQEALASADTFQLGGYSDWRLPSIKELYSLIDFSGIDVSNPNPTVFKPFIDTAYFSFGYGDENAGERLIDAQYATSTLYVSTTMMNFETMFGVNFADGRIKGYPTQMVPGMGIKTYYVMYVRGNASYGMNNFTDNGNGTITDHATGLMWLKEDNGQAVLWEQALLQADSFTFAGYDDWRLPDAKELQSIVDYTRSPLTSSSAAINPLFECSAITVEDGVTTDYPFYWASTTHENVGIENGNAAVYVCFGRAFGWAEVPPGSSNYNFWDVHGAGAQRCDFKTGNPASYPYGNGPQGDVVRIYNYYRLVRGSSSTGIAEEKPVNSISVFPNPSNGNMTISSEDDMSRISIISSNGTIVWNQENINLQQFNIQLSGNGLYIIEITTKNEIIRRKVIISQ